MNKHAFRVSDLTLIRPATPPEKQPKAIGDRVRLNSGGPVWLVVDIGPRFIVAYREDGEVIECSIPPACLTRTNWKEELRRMGKSPQQPQQGKREGEDEG